MSIKKFIDLTSREIVDLSQIGTKYMIPSTCLHNAYRVVSREIKSCAATACFYGNCPIHDYVFMGELSARFTEVMAKPKRNKVINADDILNLRIELNKKNFNLDKFLSNL